MKNKTIALILMLTILFALIPADTQAATVPTKVTRALGKAVDENGRAIIVDQTGERIYLFKRDCKTKEWKLKRTGRCIVSQKLSKAKHYMLLRNDDVDTLLWGTARDRWSCGMVIDCYEKPAYIVLHSYREHYTGRTWVKDKSRNGNDFGISVCEELAEYIWKYYTDGTAVMGV